MRVSSGLGLGLVRSADETARRGGRLSEEKDANDLCSARADPCGDSAGGSESRPVGLGILLFSRGCHGTRGGGDALSRARPGNRARRRARECWPGRNRTRAKNAPTARRRARAGSRRRVRRVEHAKADRPHRRLITPPVEEIVGGNATPRALVARVTGGGRRPRARLPRVPSDTARRRGAAPRPRGARRSPRRGTSSRTLRTSSRARRCPWPSTRRSCDRSPSPPPRPRRPRPARSAREASGRPRTRTRDPRCRSSSRSSRPRAREGECFPGTLLVMTWGPYDAFA